MRDTRRRLRVTRLQSSQAIMVSPASFDRLILRQAQDDFVMIMVSLSNHDPSTSSSFDKLRMIAPRQTANSSW
jgi:hypothetical protein